MKDPETSVLLPLQAKPEQRHGVHAFGIRQPNHPGFFIANRSDAWGVMDNRHVEPELLVNIGLALEEHFVKEQAVNMPGMNNDMDTEDRLGPES
ncbi:hypothetical protein [Mucilaginibacter sp. BT774]|uniref:hypothetical protein n=1 Tax=Mucilaginibacter sp. BT774 TaxID=3062276 RepID=UPI0026758B1A|nr:hypothetical protein [Mucilaginibacter sp. BT774]MDO3627630.1 hypothetical protein [Mucilaginibacter sp. BT774]